MKCPYDRLQLQIALISLHRRQDLDSDEFYQKLEKMGEEYAVNLPSNKAELNQKVAALNGISVIDLLNSPNYQILCDEYHDSVTKDIVKKMKEVLSITDQEAWALYCSARGLI